MVNHRDQIEHLIIKAYELNNYSPKNVELA